MQANFSNFVLPNQTLPANYSIYHGWTSPITGCSTASFNAVYFVNGGSFPFNTTDSAPCKAWKAAATLCTTQPTAYYSNTDWTCPISGGFTDPVFGTFCSVSTNYFCSDSVGTCTVVASGMMSVHNCAGVEAKFYPSGGSGFQSLSALYLHQNALTSPPPASLGTLPSAPGLSVSLWDNALAGSVPASYASFKAISLAFNPLLVGPLPANVTLAMPSALPPSSGGPAAYLYGTSIGLDRPAHDILQDMRAALDPSGQVLTWGGLNPCLPYGTQSDASVAAGQGWNGVVCKDTYSPSTKAGEGGISSVWLTFPSANATAPLQGSVPLQLRELRTAASISLAGHQLSGSLPPCWGQNYSRTYFPPSPGFDQLAYLGLASNGLSGPLPAALGAGFPAGATLGLANNALGGTLPASLANLTVTLAGCYALFGPLPRNVTGAPTVGGATVGTFNGTGLGLNTSLAAALLAVQAGLDPNLNPVLIL